MANVLKMAIVEAIRRLHALEWSARRIADELGIDRGTVGRYLKLPLEEAKPAISPPGAGDSKPATFPGLPGPLDEQSGRADRAATGGISNPAISPPGSELADRAAKAACPPGGSSGRTGSAGTSFRPGRRSHCEPYREVILAKLDQGLSGQRIYQDLIEQGFAGSYDSVKRFVRGLRGPSLPMRRMECAAGEEVQVDFGTGAPIVTPEGKRRKTWVFRMVLSHSRKAYSEATYRQTTEDFLRCLENAFWHFGGVTKTIVIDNLRAAVAHPDWFDPELVPKLASFCRHYGTVILPTKPRTPRHKGKIEAGVKYVKNNGLKGRVFKSLDEENRHLAWWESSVADTRIHGTTKRQVGKVFHEVERPALLPLPAERFASFQEAQRKVSRDGHVEVAKAYYSVPPEYLGRTVWVRWDARLVRVFNARFEQIALHVRHEQGRFSTDARHIPPEKINGIERGAAYLLNKVSVIGPHARQWAEAMLYARGIEGTRVLQGLAALARRHTSDELENACKTALSHGAWRLRTLRQLLKHKASERQQTLPFLDEHPIIRPLDDYAGVVAAALARKADSDMRFSRHGWTKECAADDQNGPGSVGHRGTADILPPRPGYPSSGCSPAEPDSVSPDPSSVVRPDSSHHSQEEKHNDE